MLKRFLLLSWLLVSGVISLYACDACGSAANGIGIGLMTDASQRYVRLSYLLTPFASNPKIQHHNSEDKFHRLNLSFQYSHPKFSKWSLLATLPFNYNYRQQGDTSYKLKGISDVNLLVQYQLLNIVSEDAQTVFNTVISGGLSLPTGKSKSVLSDTHTLPTNFNLGIGSLGYLTRIRTGLTHRNYGLMVSVNYQYNQKNHDGYRFGSQFSGQASFFKRVELGRATLIPSAGVFYELIHRNRYSSGNKVPETGGKGFFLYPSLHIKTNNWMFGMSYAVPFNQNYASGIVLAQNRMTAQLSFFF